MRRLWLLLVLAGCGGGDADPVRVAQQFHALRIAGNDPGLHALLTEADRAAIPLEAFPADLPAGLALELLAWGDARLDSASLLDVTADTAAVVLHGAAATRDTLRLLATHRPLRLWRLELDRVRWRVSLGLADRARLDSLAASMRASAGPAGLGGVEQAKAYLRAAGRRAAVARPADVDAAQSMVRKAAVAEALRIELSSTDSFTGVRVIDGRIENPTRYRLATLRLIVRDEAGAEDRVELWEVAPGSTMPVRQLTRLRRGPLTHRVERLQVF